jgi:adenylate kinase
MKYAILALSLFCALLPAQTPPSGRFIVFIGPPGSGKTTQAEAASRKYNLQIVSRGDIIAVDPQAFRDHREKGISGMTVESDPYLNDLFARKLQQLDLSKGLILDGYPATKDHADFLSKLVQEGKIPRAVIIKLSIPDEDVMKRMANSHEAKDGNLEQRLKDYHRETDLIQVYFPNADIETIDATPKESVVTKRVDAVLEKYLKK